MVFGETLADTVDVEAQLPRMILRVGSMMKAGLACLYLMDEVGGLRLASGDVGPHATRLEAAARQVVATGSAVVVQAGEGEADGGGDLDAVGSAAASRVAARPPGRSSSSATTGASTRRMWRCSRPRRRQLALVTQNAEMLQHLESSYLRRPWRVPSRPSDGTRPTTAG